MFDKFDQVEAEEVSLKQNVYNFSVDYDFIKQVFVALLSFSWYLSTKCVLFNNEPCMIRPILIDLNPVELNYYPFMVSLDKCSGRCNYVDDLSTKICDSSKTKYINVKVFNMIANIKEVTLLIKHVSISIVQHVIQIKNGNQ